MPNNTAIENQHFLFVCTACARASCDNKSGGEKLFEQFQTLHRSRARQENISIQPVRCMGVCERDCAIAFVAAGKFTYLFGDLPSDDLSLNTVASTVLSCVSQYCNHANGTLPYRERPALLKDTIIAKIPPLPAIVT